MVLIHEGQDILVQKVSVAHRRGKIRMPHRLLDQNRAFALGEPCGDPAVPEVVLVQVAWFGGRRLPSLTTLIPSMPASAIRETTSLLAAGEEGLIPGSSQPIRMVTSGRAGHRLQSSQVGHQSESQMLQNAIARQSFRGGWFQREW